MRTLKYISLVLLVALSSCTDLIDQTSENNLATDTYYSTSDEIQSALTGCYYTLQAPIDNEWAMTELRSDNTIMSSPTTTSSTNYDLDYLDRFNLSSSHTGVLSYWTNTYYSVKSINLVLDALGANYDSTTGSIELSSSITASLTDTERQNYIAEACFMRAMHYYNLVRLFGGVFLVDEPISPDDAKYVNRSSVSEIYSFIVADLVAASAYGKTETYSSIDSDDLGKANSWSAKALLAKVYLNLNRKSDAITLLNDIIANSGYGLETSYSDVFSIDNEVNQEILFSIRYKTGGLGLGNPLPNYFAPTGSSGIITGTGKNYNTPSQEFRESYTSDDTRYDVNIALYGTDATDIDQFYVNKYMSDPPSTIASDGENDWPVIRYSDVLLMLAEAQGNTSSSWDQIDLVHKRATGSTVTRDLTSTSVFETALANERRWEFAFEDQRFFDLLRFGTTLTTITCYDTMVYHFTYMYDIYYSLYPSADYDDLISNVTEDHFLLPIPQYEIDTNSYITIEQNPGY